MNYDPLRKASDRLISAVTTAIVRPAIVHLTSGARFLGLRGSRGVGKSTLLLQYARRQRKILGDAVLYASLDNLFFRKVGLYDFGAQFVLTGGKLLLLDEIHRYGSDWSVELKLLYDNFPALKVRFTSSSIIELSRAKGDLSRRASMKDVYGLSFREYLYWNDIQRIKAYTLDEIITEGVSIAEELIGQGLKPYQYFEDYLSKGYYPFYQDNPEDYHQIIGEVINTVLEQDLPPVYNITVTTGEKLKRLLIGIAESAPYKPNISKTSQFLEVNRATVQDYFYYLHQARIIGLLPRQVNGIIRTQKPEKIYLENPNLLYALPGSKPESGTLRETFVYNALATAGIPLGYPKSGDFETDKYVFEVGGKNKTNHQIKGMTNAYRVLDDVEIGGGNRIPLWLFGLLR